MARAQRDSSSCSAAEASDPFSAAKTTGRTWDDLATPDEIDAARRLIAAGLIEEYGFALQPTARCDATFDYSRRWEPPSLSALYGR